MSIYAQRRFRWRGLWLLPYLAISIGRGVCVQVGLLFWLWDIHINSRRLARWTYVLNEIYLLPAALVQKSQTLSVKVFFLTYFYEWESRSYWDRV